jgi:hypothetical protein
MRLEPPFIRQDRRFRRKLEAVRAVAEDVAERGAVAQNRSEIEEVSRAGAGLHGTSLGEQYKRKLGPADDEMVIARQLLRSKASD